jgi:6-pyruvoyltetrahydropterin/6-carboxytetrahydropterin synthase
MVRLTRAIEFSTSLRCARPDLSDAENERLYGPDARQHGHNYRLEVTVRGEPDPRTGMVVDLKDVQDILEREIMERFDHRDLNRDTPYFEKDAPTHENFARVIERILLAALPAGWLDRIRLQPEADTWVEIVLPGSIGSGSSDSARLRRAAGSAHDGAGGGGA